MRLETETIIARAALYNLWNMCFHGVKQTQTETAKLITCRPPTVLDIGAMVHIKRMRIETNYQ